MMLTTRHSRWAVSGILQCPLGAVRFHLSSLLVFPRWRPLKSPVKSLVCKWKGKKCACIHSTVARLAAVCSTAGCYSFCFVFSFLSDLHQDTSFSFISTFHSSLKIAGFTQPRSLHGRVRRTSDETCLLPPEGETVLGLRNILFEKIC